MQYRKKVISGFMWSAGEKFATAAVRILSGIIVLRYLFPAEFGVVELLAIFSFIAYTIVDSGFSQALIRKKDAGEKDYNSIFYLNVAIALALYILLVGLSWPLARFFGQATLTSIAPVLFLTLPLSALGLIQTTLMSRKMDFGALSKISFTATILSCALLIILAAMGFGPWALVWQSVANELIKTVLLWIASRWRPKRIFSTDSVRELYSFGSRLFLTGIINQIFGRVSTVIIGRFHSVAQVGYYNQSLKFKDSIAAALGQSVHNVSYPALASFQDNEDKLRMASRQVVQVLSFILFPVMAGLIAVAPEGFAGAGGEKWLPAVGYFRIFCLAAFFMPLSNAAINILRAKGLGNTILRAEIIKKIFAAGAITIAAFLGVKALAWAYVVWNGFEMAVNCYLARKTNGYGFRMQMADTMPYLAMSVAMYTAVQAVGIAAIYTFPELSESCLGCGITVAVKAVAGIAVYLLLSVVFKPAAWSEARSVIKGIAAERYGSYPQDA
ncbi:MAG: lipopolysaccharide biosynthesis protein [Rikenellaceae bacterium]|nr:lipopolysaccharide biosynthesis protein [Rikenellaceae bacterium]